MNRLGAIFVTLFVVYTLAWAVVCWFMQRARPEAPMKYHATPVETTTAEERARGESSFEIARGAHQFGITRGGFFTLVAIGYLVLAVIFLIAFIKFRSSVHDL
jgi:hypothetical protein